jgi:hypothetical protein
MNREANAFMNNLTQAARDNPLAAALIGGGALWLLCGNRAFGSMAAGAASIAQPVADAGMRGMSSAADAVTGAGSRATEAVAQTARSMTRTATEAAASGAAAIRDRATEGVNRTAETLGSAPDPRPYLEKGYAGIEKGYSSAQSALTDLLERQPLVLGAIGIAIGAGVANAIGKTSVENEWAGSLSDEFKDAVKGRAEHVAETAKRAGGDVASEFRAAAGEAADKLRKTGEEAVQAVKETADAGREF